MLSEELRAAIKTSKVRHYRLAQMIGVHPSQFSAWNCGIYPPKVGDPRVVALGALVGVPADRCFAVAAGADHAGTR